MSGSSARAAARQVAVIRGMRRRFAFSAHESLFSAPPAASMASNSALWQGWSALGVSLERFISPGIQTIDAIAAKVRDELFLPPLPVVSLEPCFPGTAFPWKEGYSSPSSSSEGSILEEDATMLFAVPKRRTSHSVKRLRKTHKYIRKKENIVTCKECGNPKLLHHLCSHCHPFNKWVRSKGMTLRHEISGAQLTRKTLRKQKRAKAVKMALKGKKQQQQTVATTE